MNLKKFICRIIDVPIYDWPDDKFRNIPIFGKMFI